MANTGPTWVLLVPGRPHVGPMNSAMRGNIPSLFITTLSLQGIYSLKRCHLRVHLHQRGAGPPAGAGAFSARVESLHWRGPHAVSPFVEAPFRGTGSLIYRYWPIRAPYSCGSHRRIAPWAISAGARRRPAAEAPQARGGLNSTTQFLQTDPLQSPWAGSARAPRAFYRVGVNAP